MIGEKYSCTFHHVEDVVIVKDFETRKGEWDVRDVANFPEVFFKEYNNYVGTVDSDFHDEQVEVDIYWNNNKKRSLNVREYMDITIILQSVRHHFCNYDVYKWPMTENRLGFVMAQEDLELIWNLENDWDRVIPRESGKETNDVKKLKKTSSSIVMSPFLFTSPGVNRKRKSDFSLKKETDTRMRRWKDRISCYRKEKRWTFTVKPKQWKGNIFLRLLRLKKRNFCVNCL